MMADVTSGILELAGTLQAEEVSLRHLLFGRPLQLQIENSCF